MNESSPAKTEYIPPSEALSDKAPANVHGANRPLSTAERMKGIYEAGNNTTTPEMPDKTIPLRENETSIDPITSSVYRSSPEKFIALEEIKDSKDLATRRFRAWVGEYGDALRRGLYEKTLDATGGEALKASMRSEAPALGGSRDNISAAYDMYIDREIEKAEYLARVEERIAANPHLVQWVKKAAKHAQLAEKIKHGEAGNPFRAVDRRMILESEIDRFIEQPDIDDDIAYFINDVKDGKEYSLIAGWGERRYNPLVERSKALGRVVLDRVTFGKGIRATAGYLERREAIDTDITESHPVEGETVRDNKAGDFAVEAARAFRENLQDRKANQRASRTEKIDRIRNLLSPTGLYVRLRESIRQENDKTELEKRNQDKYRRRLGLVACVGTAIAVAVYQYKYGGGSEHADIIASAETPLSPEVDVSSLDVPSGFVDSVDPAPPQHGDIVKGEKLNLSAFAVPKWGGGEQLLDKLGVDSSQWYGKNGLGSKLVARFPEEFYRTESNSVRITHKGPLSSAAQQFILDNVRR